MALLAAAATPGLATFTSEVRVVESVIVPGQTFHIDLTVNNTGTSDLVFGENTLANGVTASPNTGIDLGIFWFNNLDGMTVAPGQSHTFTASGRTERPGTWTISCSLQCRDSVAGVQTVSGNVSVTVMSAAEAEALHPVRPGSIEIRGNILRIGNTSGYQRALVVVRGPRGESVQLSIRGPSGSKLGGLRIESAVADGSGWLQIGSDGVATVAISGALGQGELKTGVYWVVATGAVTDRKPILILNGNE